MKKLVLLLAVTFSVSMFSCGGGESTENKDSVADSAAQVEQQVSQDSVAQDSVAGDSVKA